MIKVGIVGGTGYTGVELLRLLVRHEQVELRLISSRGEAGRPVSDLFTNLRGHTDLHFSEPDIDALAGCELVFFATPNGVAMQSVPELLARGVRVIDLAADFRLRDARTWSRWYGQEHACAELLDAAVYGLPELNREEIREARLVANPGCYPTAVSLGFLPLLRAGVVLPGSLIADAKSGVSGAGRSAAVASLYSEAAENFKAYGVAGHRHLPEIRQTLEQLAGEAVGLVFVPHLTPMVRGIHASLYARLRSGTLDLQALFEDCYDDEPFVDVLPAGSHPETRSVRAGNYCRIAVHRPQDGDTVVVLAVIDNLVKGAAGQAIQNMNLMFGLDERLGLDAPGLIP